MDSAISKIYLEDTRTSKTGFVSECLKFMKNKGLPLNEKLICDGKIHYYSVNNNNDRNTDEWYVAYTETSGKGNKYLCCLFGSRKESKPDKVEFKSWDLSNKKYTKKERDQFDIAYQKAISKADEDIKSRIKEAKRQAEHIWEKAGSEIDKIKTHPYILQEKREIQDTISSIKYLNYCDDITSIVIPVKDINDELTALQFISVDNKSGLVKKTFLPGSQTKRSFFTTDFLNQCSSVYVCEGWATSVILRQAINKNEAVVAALSSSNILNVCKEIQKKYKKMNIIICPDIGAEYIFKNIGHRVIYPSASREKKKGYDFYNLYKEEGLEAIKGIIYQTRPSVKIGIISDDLWASNLPKENEDCCKDFSLEHWPKIIKENIEEKTELSETHPIMVGSSTLSCFSGYLKTHLFMDEGDYFAKLYIVLWILNVAHSGCFKSTALDKALIEILQLSEKLEESQETKINPLIPERITAEALFQLLNEQGGGVLTTSEFGAFLKTLESSYNSSLRGLLTDLYDVPAIRSCRTMKGGTTTLKRPFISLAGVSTLPWIREVLTNSDLEGGFLARFLIFNTGSKNQIPRALPPKEFANKSYTSSKKIIEILQHMKSQQPISYHFSPSARSSFEYCHNQIYKIAPIFEEERLRVDPFLKRWSPYILKIGMQLRFFEDPNSNELSDTSIGAAYNLVRCGMRSTMSLLRDELFIDPHTQDCKRILDWMIKRELEEQTISFRNLTTSNKFKGENSSDEYRKCLKTLVDQGKVIMQGCEDVKFVNIKTKLQLTEKPKKKC